MTKTKLTDQNRRKFYVYLAVILGITLFIYFPSFSHLLRSETYTFFLNTLEHNSIIEIFNHNMFNGYLPGDTWLFRPFLYAMLGLEMKLFGFQYTLWHVTAFCLHALVAACLFRLLWAIKPGILALLFTLVFAVGYVSINTILYVQIASYSVFLALLLTGLFYVYRGAKYGKGSDIIIALTCMFVASLFYELGIVFLALTGVFLWGRRSKIVRKEWKYVLLAILIIWPAAFAAQKILNPNALIVAEFNILSNIEGIIYGIVKAPSIASTWLFQIALPSAWGLIPIGFLEGHPANFERLPLNWLLIPNVIALGALAYLLYPKRQPDNKSTVSIPFKLLIGLMLCAFMLVTSIFRAASRGVDSYILVINSNADTFLLLLIILLYILFALRKFTVKHTTYISLTLLFFIALSGFKVFTVNCEINQVEQPTKAYLSEVNSFVELHQNEPDFSFVTTAASYRLQKNMTLHLWRHDQLGQITWHHHTVPQILHHEYWDEENPKYTLRYNGEQLIEARGRKP